MSGNSHQRRVARRTVERVYGPVVRCEHCDDAGQEIVGQDERGLLWEACLFCGGRGLVHQRQVVAIDRACTAYRAPVVR